MPASLVVDEVDVAQFSQNTQKLNLFSRPGRDRSEQVTNGVGGLKDGEGLNESQTRGEGERG